MRTARNQHGHEQRLQRRSEQTTRLLQDTTRRGVEAMIRGRGLGSNRHAYGENVIRLGTRLESTTGMSCDCKCRKPNSASLYACAYANYDTAASP